MESTQSWGFLVRVKHSEEVFTPDVHLYLSITELNEHTEMRMRSMAGWGRWRIRVPSFTLPSSILIPSLWDYVIKNVFHYTCIQWPWFYQLWIDSILASCTSSATEGYSPAVVFEYWTVDCRHLSFCSRLFLYKSNEHNIVKFPVISIVYKLTAQIIFTKYRL